MSELRGSTIRSRVSARIDAIHYRLSVSSAVLHARYAATR
jgi:hypothetical protein